MNRNEKFDSSTLVAAVIEEAKKLQVDHAEAYFEEGEELSIEVRDGEVENLKVARDADLVWGHPGQPPGIFLYLKARQG